MASKANHYDIDADDFDLIAVFKGNQIPELGTI